VTPVTEVYGLGAILYAMLTGRPPRQAATVAETRTLIRPPPVAPSRSTAARPATWNDLLALFATDREGSWRVGRWCASRGLPLLAGKPVSGKRRWDGNCSRRLAALVPGLVLFAGDRPGGCVERILGRGDVAAAARPGALAAASHFERRPPTSLNRRRRRAGLAAALYTRPARRGSAVDSVEGFSPREDAIPVKSWRRPLGLAADPDAEPP
jgi:hypothetical protein